MLFKDIIATINAKSRSEWSVLVHEYLTDLRIWLQENGEVAALAGLLAGILIVLFFKLFVFLIVFGGLVAYAIWQLAEPDIKNEVLDNERVSRDSPKDEHED